MTTYDHRGMFTAEGRLQNHLREIKAIRDAMDTGYLSAKTFLLIQQDLKNAQSHTHTFVKAARLEQGSI